MLLPLYSYSCNRLLTIRVVQLPLSDGHEGHWPARKHLSKGRTALYQKVDREFLPLLAANLYLLVDEMLAVLLLKLGILGKIVRSRNAEVVTCRSRKLML